MMMTEEEARTKWCPHARASDQADPPSSVNRVRTNKPDGDCLCVASGCMAWRWSEEDCTPPGSNGIGEPVEAHAVGYCGAFGKPEA
ncbi:hypothetical protein [Azospirillum sp. Marseille-Q6669]